MLPVRVLVPWVQVLGLLPVQWVLTWIGLFFPDDLSPRASEAKPSAVERPCVPPLVGSIGDRYSAPTSISS